MSETAPEPADGLGDGTETVPTVLPVNVATLTQQQASDYRHELIRVIFETPGTELDVNSTQYAVDLAAYEAQLAAVDAYLLTFPEKI